MRPIRVRSAQTVAYGVAAVSDSRRSARMLHGAPQGQSGATPLNIVTIDRHHASWVIFHDELPLMEASNFANAWRAAKILAGWEHDLQDLP
jgi:hypothetical protein